MSKAFVEGSRNLNVFKKPLYLFSKDPMTGFYRDGYCNVGPEDKGNHSIAATLTEEFLDFSASRGNNLRDIGLKGGCKWCLCAARWKEALDYASSQSQSQSQQSGFPTTNPLVPKVHLHATSEKALDILPLSSLQKFAAEPEAGNASNVAQSRKGGMGGKIKERSELAGKGDMTSRE